MSPEVPHVDYEPATMQTHVVCGEEDRPSSEELSGRCQCCAAGRNVPIILLHPTVWEAGRQMHRAHFTDH